MPLLKTYIFVQSWTVTQLDASSMTAAAAAKQHNINRAYKNYDTGIPAVNHTKMST